MNIVGDERSCIANEPGTLLVPSLVEFCPASHHMPELSGVIAGLYQENGMIMMMAVAR